MTSEISRNAKLKEWSIQFLKVFHHLNALDITSCCFSTHGLKQLHNEMCLRRLEEDEIDDKGLDVFCRSVENIGWASKVVEDWISGSRVTTEKRLPQGCPKARKFYSSSSSRLGFLDVSVKTPSLVSTSSQLFIRLVRDTKKRHDIPPTEVKQAHQTSESQLKGMKEGKHVTVLSVKKFTQELQIIQEVENTVEKGGKSGHCMLQDSDQGLQKHTSVIVDEATCLPSSKIGLKVKVKRKRKRHSSDDEARSGNMQSAFEDDDRDLMNSYLKIRTDADVDLDKKGDRSKLMRAMDSSNW